MTGVKMLVGLLAACGPTLAQAECYKTVSELKANRVKTRWHETTANDGKPMTIAIVDGSDGLVFAAKKAGSLWLHGDVSVCGPKGAADITLKDTRATENVPMLTKMALPSTLSARVVSNQINLSGGGWSGTFVGQ